MKRLFPLCFCVCLLFFPFKSTFPATFQKNELLEYSISLFEKEDYYRSVTELLRFEFSYPNHNNSRATLYFVKNYYHLENYSLLENIALKWLNSPFSMERKIEKEVGTLLTLSYLNQEKEQKAKKTWEKYILHQPTNDFPLGAEVMGQLDPEEAHLYSTLLPGSGFLLSGEYQKASVSFLLNALFLAGIYQHYHQENYAIAGLLFFFEVGWYDGGRRGAVESVENYNQKLILDARSSWKAKQNFDVLSY